MANGRPRGLGGVFEEEIKGRALVSMVAYEVEPRDRATFYSPAVFFFRKFQVTV